MNEKRLLQIFIKNPRKGYVKTRLAKTVGDEKAYQTYLKLVNYTLTVAKDVDARKQIWFSSFIDEIGRLAGTFSNNPDKIFKKKLQRGDDLGKRMSNAFKEGFRDGSESVVIIGSDCPDITPQIIENGFQMLDRCDVVIGPSDDGGYYLIGTKAFIPELFEDIPWSSSSVYSETIKILKEKKFRYGLLPALNDIDTEEDLKRSDFA